jgi:hypothetical protein
MLSHQPLTDVWRPSVSSTAQVRGDVATGVFAHRAGMRLFTLLPICPVLAIVILMAGATPGAGTPARMAAVSLTAIPTGASSAATAQERVLNVWAERVASRKGTWHGTASVDQVTRGRTTNAVVSVQMWRENCDVAGCLDVHSEGRIVFDCPVLEESGTRGQRRMQLRISMPITTTTSRVVGDSVTVLERVTTTVPVAITAVPAAAGGERHFLRSTVRSGERRDLNETIVRQSAAQVRVAVGPLSWSASAGGVVHSTRRSSAVVTSGVTPR